MHIRIVRINAGHFQTATLGSLIRITFICPSILLGFGRRAVVAYIEKITADLWSFFTMAAAIVQPQSSSLTNKSSSTLLFSPRQNVYSLEH